MGLCQLETSKENESSKAHPGRPAGAAREESSETTLAVDKHGLLQDDDSHETPENNCRNKHLHLQYYLYHCSPSGKGLCPKKNRASVMHALWDEGADP